MPLERAARIIAGLGLHRERNEAVAVCIDYFKAKKERMHYDLYRKRRFPVGSAAESASKQIVRSRFKRAGTNALLAVKCCLENNR